MTEREEPTTESDPLAPKVCSDPGNPDHYPYQPSDWGDFDTPDGGCVVCGIIPQRQI